MYFLLNKKLLQVFVRYLTGALYMHRLWFYKHQHDNRVRSELSVACQRWWFQWRFWFVPSIPGYLREEEEHKPDPWRNPIERNHMGLHLENEVAVVKTPTIISNNPVYTPHTTTEEFFFFTNNAIFCSKEDCCHITAIRDWHLYWKLFSVRFFNIYKAFQSFMSLQSRHRD